MQNEGFLPKFPPNLPHFTQILPFTTNSVLIQNEGILPFTVNSVLAKNEGILPKFYLLQ